MASSQQNVITHGMSGKLGDIIVFSQRNGKTIVSKAPTRKAELSDKQKQHFEHFQQATIYAKAALQDPARKAQYEQTAARKEGVTSYNVAVADLIRAPKIEEINLSSYHGNVGDIIVVRAVDDFKVVSVAVAIYNSDGTLVEQGNALNNNGPLWVYTATVNNPNLSGDKIVVRATDLPDNLAEKEVVL